MDIVIHQSLCGENSKKAWDLLQTTLPDSSIARSIAIKADLQDQAHGITWKPTIRAFMQDDFFLLMRTFSDRSRDVRPGRTFSHVLLIPRNAIDSVIDIGSLFKYLPNDIDKSISISPITFNPNELSGTVLPDGFQDRFNKAIHGYKRFSQFKNTIIWIGQEDYEQAISKFWQLLSQSEKEYVNFGIYFNAVAIPDGKLNFVTTPENIESKFLNREFCVIRRNDTQVLTEIAEQILAGDITASQRIRTFQETLETNQLSRLDIDRIAIILKTFEEIDVIDDLKKIVTLSHVIAEFSKDERQGVGYKKKLLDKICSLIEQGGVNEIALVRNFDLTSFKESRTKLEASIRRWLKAQLFSVEQTSKKDFSSLFIQLKLLQTGKWWTNLIKVQIEAFLSEIDSKVKAHVVYNWLRTNFDIFEIIKSRIDLSRSAESFFISELPEKLSRAQFTALKQFAAHQSWYRFHATLLLNQHPFDLALTLQLEVDTDSNYFDGIDIILRGANSNMIIDFTLSNGDSRLIDAASKICHDTPSELQRISFANPYWQDIWLRSIALGNTILEGFTNPQEKIFEFFDAIIDGTPVNIKLIQMVADTQFTDILHYHKREALWGKLPGNLRTIFLRKTAASLLESLSINPTIKVPADAVLSDYIMTNAIGDFLYFNSNNIKSAIPIFNKFSAFPENYIAIYIRNYNSEISAIDATQIGKLINERHYQHAANEVFSKSNAHSNWKFALAECYTLLSFFDQMQLAWTGIVKNINITSDQWWESVEDLIIDLYPNANSLFTIWKKGGGDEADLLMNASPRKVWNDAIYNLRADRFTEIDICSLLKQIKKDYGENERFKIIYGLRKKYTSC
jgi:hypothetical protein